MIPKNIFTVWLSEDGSMPDLVKRCIESQKIPDYEHTVITLDNLPHRENKYMQECLNSPHLKKRWCKASDYIRMLMLRDFGGIYLDADVEILAGKNFDDMLDNQMFVGQEKLLPGVKDCWLGSAVVGAEKDHWFVNRWIEEVESRFRGDDDKNFESSMEILTERYYHTAKKNEGFAIYPPEYFYPYCHQLNTIEITPNTRAYHHFLKTWV